MIMWKDAVKNGKFRSRDVPGCKMGSSSQVEWDCDDDDDDADQNDDCDENDGGDDFEWISRYGDDF